MKKQIQRSQLESILQATCITDLSFKELIRFFQEEEQIATYRPEATYQFDPRSSEIVVYSTARNHRPNDQSRPTQEPAREEKECVICSGKTTGVLDVCDLNEGFTFINKNLYPILFPAADLPSNTDNHPLYAVAPNLSGPAWGFHFLQWTSSIHAHDWHNLPLTDCVRVMQRLAALEGYLLQSGDGHMPANADWGGRDTSGFVSIIKNSGRSVGGSLEHGHQQITYSTFPPGRIRANWMFEQKQAEPFSAYMLRENPARLTVLDYGPARLLVPYFMRRPYNMLLLLKDTSKRYLYELDEQEIYAVAQGWQQATRMVHQLMPRLGKPVAFNILTHNGPGAGLYFEFLPFTQAYGGFERLGFSVCQQSARQAAQILRELVSSD